MTSHFSLQHTPAEIQDDDSNDFSCSYSLSSFRLLLACSGGHGSHTWDAKRHHGAVAAIFPLCFAVVFVHVVVALVVRFVPRMRDPKRTPPVQTLLSHTRPIVAAPPPRRPGGGVGVAVGDDVDASLCGVDESLSLRGIRTHCLATQHSSESDIVFFLYYKI